MSRIYLGRRDVRDAATASSRAHEAIVEWRSTEIRNALGQRFRSSIHVELRRPRWMPGPLYRALMRSIVVETQAERTR